MMKVTTPHSSADKHHKEHVISWLVFGTFFALVLLNWIFGFFDSTFFIFSVLLYVLLGLGIIISMRAARIVGIENFAGKSLSSFGVMFASYTLSTLLLDYVQFFFEKNTIVSFIAYGLWVLGTLFAILGLDHILQPKKYIYEPKHSYMGALLFFIVFIISLFAVGIPVIDATPLAFIIVDYSMIVAYTALISAAIITLLIGKKNNIVDHTSLLAIGLLGMALSYFFAAQNFTVIADIFLLGGLIITIVGTYSTQSTFEKKKVQEL